MPDPASSSVAPPEGPALPGRSAHARRNAVLVALGVVLAGAGAWWWFGRVSLERAGQPGPHRAAMGRSMSGQGRPSATVGTAPVARLDVPVTITAIGTVQPTVSATVRSQVSGVLTSIRFVEGGRVDKGQVLAEVDAGPFRQAVSQAQGVLERDRAQLAVAGADLERYQALWAQDSIARQQVDTQLALVRQLQGTVQADQAAVNAAQINLGYATVRAPVAGRIGLRRADVGNYVTASDANGIAVITVESPMDVGFALPQAEIARVREAVRHGVLPVTVVDQSGQTELARGRFSTLDNAIDVTTGTVKAKARFDNRDGRLFPNQFVNIRLQVGTIPQALVVPVSAVRYGPDGSFVFVLQADQTVRIVSVVTGVAAADGIVVSGALAAGDTVVAEGADRLDDGSRVVLAGPPREGAAPARGRGSSPGAPAAPP